MVDIPATTDTARQNWPSHSWSFSMRKEHVMACAGSISAQLMLSSNEPSLLAYVRLSCFGHKWQCRQLWSKMSGGEAINVRPLRVSWASRKKKIQKSI
ncbi:uncharacterized protein [Lolium perenne]|uniref:uncharacterized protein isoform X2 n=1 Tax=Lolium perenne TaxID=4522 RepID=UPI003A990F3B